MEQLHYTILALPYQANAEQQRSVQFQLVQGLLGPQLSPALRLLPTPHLKVGTLDSLIEASDELARLDPLLEGVAFRLCSIIEDVGNLARASAATVRVSSSSHGVACDHIVKEFNWANALYDPSEPISSLCRKFGQVAQGAEERTRGIITDFSDTKSKLAQAQRKFTGSWQVRPIKEPVDAWCKSLGIPKPWDTEFLTTLFLAIPNGEPLLKWRSAYTSINEFVVPQSSHELVADKDFTLVSLVCFKKVLEDVKNYARKHKFFIRDYHSTDDLSVAEFETLQTKARADKDKITVLLSQQFSQCFIAWMHVKVARMFVESHLKFGVTAQFVPIIIAVDEKRQEEIKLKLDAAYKNFSTPFAITEQGSVSHGADAGSLAIDLPYISLKVSNILRTR